jgi:hypothetical protein
MTEKMRVHHIFSKKFLAGNFISAIFAIDYIEIAYEKNNTPLFSYADTKRTSSAFAGCYS